MFDAFLHSIELVAGKVGTLPPVKGDDVTCRTETSSGSAESRVQACLSAELDHGRPPLKVCGRTWVRTLCDRVMTALAA